MMNCILLSALLSAQVESAERVSFETEDGHQIVADFYARDGDSPTAICLPMYLAERSSFQPLVEPLRERGFQNDRRGRGGRRAWLGIGLRERGENVFEDGLLDSDGVG